MVAAPRAPAPRLPFGSTTRTAPRRSGVRLAPRRAAPPPPPGPPLVCLLGLGSVSDLQPAPLLAAGLGGRAGDAAAPAGEQPAPPGFCFAAPVPMSLATCAGTQHAQAQALRQLSAACTKPRNCLIGSVSQSDSQESSLCSSAAPAQWPGGQCNAWHSRTHSSSSEQGPDSDPLRCRAWIDPHLRWACPTTQLQRACVALQGQLPSDSALDRTQHTNSLGGIGPKQQRNALERSTLAGQRHGNEGGARLQSAVPAAGRARRSRRPGRRS